MSEFRATRLWRETLAAQPRDEHKLARERLRIALEKFRERAAVLAGEISQDIRDLTAHDITHIDALWETAGVIMGDSISLTPTEAFVLGGAFMIHDLGMGLAAYPDGLSELQARPEWSDLIIAALSAKLGRDPNPAEIANPPPQVVDDTKFLVLRALHAERAEELARISWTAPQSGERFYLLEDPELRAAFGALIGKVAHSHWWATALLPEKFPPTKIGTPITFPNEWTIDALKLALILRLADAAHLDGRRAPAFLRAVRRPKGQSGLHWEFQEKLYQVHREGDRLIYTSQPFQRIEAQSWWLCYETLQTVNTELRRADNLNADLGRERFAARGIRGVEDPHRLAELIPTNGWLPVDARVSVGHVAKLVSKLGGHELYGDDTSVPLRELIQNAADAVRARRILESRSERWGTVYVRTGTDEDGPWVEVEDNGVGMSTEVLTGPFLDFGVSYWSTLDAIIQFPSLRTRGFQSTGRYGIGFFSVFMWADRVRVTTRQYNEAVRDTNVLEFEKGLDVRPLLRPAEPGEWIKDGGTRVRVWPRNVSKIDSDWIHMWGTDEEFFLDSGRGNPLSVAQWLCVTVDVDLMGQAGSGKPKPLINASDWMDMPGELFLDRMMHWPDRSVISKKIAGSNLRPLMHNNGRVIGRATIVPETISGCIAVGGFRTGTSVSVAGVFLGESTRASRDEATVLVSPEELARWATEQAALIASAGLPDAAQAKCARLIGMLGGDVGQLALAKANGAWLHFEEFVEWSRAQESILIINVANEDRARGQLGAIALRSNVVVEPSSADSLYADVLWRLLRYRRGHGDFSSGYPEMGRRPVLAAIAAAWAPMRIEVWKSEFSVDDDDLVSVNAEEVRRRDDDPS